jgi:Uma2 family endonuclease
MPIVENSEDIEVAKSILRSLPANYMIHRYDATVDEYEQITDEDIKCEFVDGELIMHSPASPEHEELGSFVNALLRIRVDELGFGRVYGPNVVMQLGERRFSPDASVLRNENLGRIVDRPSPRVVGPMDLVVEILSKSTRDYDQRTKLPAYRDGLVPEIWFIDPKQRQFTVDVLRGHDYDRHVLSTGRWNSVSLPGIAIQADWLWQTPLPPVSSCHLD